MNGQILCRTCLLLGHKHWIHFTGRGECEYTLEIALATRDYRTICIVEPQQRQEIEGKKNGEAF